jgi:hypothetical protein
LFNLKQEANFKRILYTLFLLGVLLCLAIPAAIPAAASANTYYVANSGSDSNPGTSASPWLTIGHALTIASSGDTISIAAGTYPEQLTITKPVTLMGAGATTIINPMSISVDTTALASGYHTSGQGLSPIILVNGTNGANVENLEVNGAGSSNANMQNFCGIVFQDASGTISKTTVKNVAQPSAYFGDQQGWAVFIESDSAGTSNVNILSNTLSGYQKAGILCAGPKTTCTITGNTVTGAGRTAQIAQNGIEILYGASAAVESNQISANSYSAAGDTENYFTASDQSGGVLLNDAATTSVVSNNTVSFSDVGVWWDSATVVAPSGNVVVSNNVLENNYGYGVVFDSVNGVSAGNSYQNNLAGLLVTDSASNAAVTSITDQFTNNAANSQSLDYATQQSQTQTYSAVLVLGTKKLDIAYLVTNDEDSGIPGYWALDNYTKTLQVWQLADGSYYGIGGYSGTWQTFAGALSPMAGVVQPRDGSGPYNGTWTGTFTFSGAFNPSAKPVSGNIGSYDFGGTKVDVLKGTDGSGQTGDTSAVSVLGLYFPAYANFNYDNWSWTYTYGSQAWINSSTGNSGDIVLPSTPITTTISGENGSNDAIQTAINGALPGDTISVAAGSYPEQLSINKSLTLVGSGPTTIIKPSSVTQTTPRNSILDNGYASLYPVILVNGNSSGSISGVNVENLEVDGSIAGPAFNNDNFCGIVYNNASGTISGTTVNYIELSNPPSSANFGLQSGVGIFVQSVYGGISNVNTNNNVVSNFQKNGIVYDDTGTAGTVNGNTVMGVGPIPYIAQNGIEVARGATAIVTNNIISSISYSTPGNTQNYFTASAQSCGVLLYNPASSVVVSNNKVSYCDIGIGITDDDGTTGTGNLAVSNNTLSNNYGYGLVFDGVNGTSTGNTFQSNPFGLLVTDYASNSTVTSSSDQFTANTISAQALDYALQTGKTKTYAAVLNVPNSPFKITPSAASGGSLSPSTPVSVNFGSSQTFSITPNVGYHVASVLVDGASVGPVYSYSFSNVTANHVVSANFAPNAAIPVWDITGGHLCDYQDLTLLGIHYGETGTPGWIPEDINLDGVVDYKDLTILGLHYGQTWSMGDYINYYTINDGTNPFTRSLTPQDLVAGNVTRSQSITSDGTVKLIIANAPGYSDVGFYIYAGQLKNLNSVNVQAVSGSSPFGLNLYFDKDGNGDYFNWNNNVLTGLGNDAYILGPTSQNGVLGINSSSQFTSLNPGGGNYTLAQLKNGSASGISGDTPVAIWVGITTNGGSLNTTISSVSIK